MLPFGRWGWVGIDVLQHGYIYIYSITLVLTIGKLVVVDIVYTEYSVAFG